MSRFVIHPHTRAIVGEGVATKNVTSKTSRAGRGLYATAHNSTRESSEIDRTQ